MKFIHPKKHYRLIKNKYYNKYVDFIRNNMPKHYADYLYKQSFGYHIDWKNPRDLNEWINYLSFSTDTTQWSLLADKYAVRAYVAEKGLEDILLTLYGKWESPEDIDFDTLPNSFAIKTNCSSGDTIIVQDKVATDFSAIKERIKCVLDKRDIIFLLSGEPHYLRIKPLVICEELIPQSYTTDYKVWCFYGKPFGILTCSNRVISSHYTDFNFYDLDWQRHDEWISEPYRNAVDVKKPKYLDKMIEYAGILSEGFPQVRVDFYETPDKVFFGEMTFTSACGRMKYLSREALKVMGEMVARGR